MTMSLTVTRDAHLHWALALPASVSPLARLAVVHMLAEAVGGKHDWWPAASLAARMGREVRAARRHLATAVAAGAITEDEGRYAINWALMETQA